MPDYDSAFKWTVIQEYIDGKNLPEIHRTYGVGTSSISRWLKQVGVPTRPPSETKRTHTLNEAAFDVETEEAKYWIGFLMADGCISRNGCKASIDLGLSIGDEDHVARFRDFLGSNHAIRTRAGAGYENSKPVVTLHVDSRRLVDRLACYGVVPRKSKTARVIGLEMDRHFWRGVVDGDGFIGANYMGYPEIGLTGSYELMSQYRDFFLTLCPHSKSVVRKMHRIFTFRVACTMGKTLIRALYEDCTIALPRKWEGAKAVMNGEPLPPPGRRGQVIAGNPASE
jgi:hypothetical protein